MPTETAKPELEHAFDKYVSARAHVINNGYEPEIDWQASRNVSRIDEQEFLREAAWVILNGGMRESVVRTKFPAISSAFYDFESSLTIVENRRRCVERGIASFNHPKKLEAIVGVACRIALEGFETVKGATTRYGSSFLRSFDYIGPVTSKHLAKNLGVAESKPDRHLQRIAEALQFSDVATLCSELSNLSGDSVPVVDVVMWRFATLRRDYQDWFGRNSKRPVADCF